MNSLEISYELYNPEDKEHQLHTPLTSTYLSQLEACPRLGIIHGFQGKRYEDYVPRQCLSMGTFIHTLISGIHLFELARTHPEEAKQYSTTLYKTSIVDKLDFSLAITAGRVDRLTDLVYDFLSPIIYSDLYKEDPTDKKRSLQNVEDVIYNLLQHWRFGQYIPYCKNGVVGIEMLIDIILTQRTKIMTKRRRLSAKLDFFGEYNGTPILVDYKSSGLISEVWEQKFIHNHQITLYALLLHTVFGIDINKLKIHVIGVQVPLPKKSRLFGGSIVIPVKRTSEDFIEWFDYVNAQQETLSIHSERPWRATKNTGSCIQYNSTCPLFEFCALPEKERIKAYHAFKTVDPLAYHNLIDE